MTFQVGDTVRVEIESVFGGRPNRFLGTITFVPERRLDFFHVDVEGADVRAREFDLELAVRPAEAVPDPRFKYQINQKVSYDTIGGRGLGVVMSLPLSTSGVYVVRCEGRYIKVFEKELGDVKKG